ncbi:Uncharacterised protein [Salmonella enterica subsp. enterica]|uniref:Uncharacterized protein n=1 Tax=Salmonella enterica I TaxID=59201 RepID=A0A380CCI6_SALET|nr:Uncharacterised protein [Salmonella enterica subsp. enterica]
MDQEMTFSLSYEQLTRFAENASGNAIWTARARFISAESAKAGAVLIFWHELAINGYASMNAIKRQELIDATFSASESSSGRRMTGNDPEPPTVATAAESADCAGCP